MTDDLVERVARAIQEAQTPAEQPFSAWWDWKPEARAALAVAFEEAARMAEKATPRAHTYASENADIYRAYDKGAADAIKALRARAKEFEVKP